VSDTRLSVTKRHICELADVDENLFAIFMELMDIWPGPEVYVTCIYRDAEEDASLGGSGIHETVPHRAIDVRIKNLVGDFQVKADEVAATLNNSWFYDPKRPIKSVAISKVHGNGPHVHLQCHANTKRRPVN